MASAKRLRALLADQSKIIVCPGVYDGLTARIALNAGFECLYMVTKTPKSGNLKLYL
jgi:2-methylisocitrate lyase-like PEP mutase family enzyme